MKKENPKLLALGLMSGTSLDGIDLALIETDGIQVSAQYGGLTHSYPESFREKLRNVILKELYNVEDIKELEMELTFHHLKAIEMLLSQKSFSKYAQKIDVIGFHGQTLVHKKNQAGKILSIQIGAGAWLSEQMKTPVVFDFRSNDILNGGQGAPLVPLYHQALSEAQPSPLLIINIGGVCNVTYIDKDTESLIAFDVGPGGALIDDFVFQKTGQSYDEGGIFASQGVANQEILKQYKDNPFFLEKPPKSLDRNTFKNILKDVKDLSVKDGCATLVALTCHGITAALNFFPSYTKKVVIVGGGRKNHFLRVSISSAFKCPVVVGESIGLDGDLTEAEAFAFLAVRSLFGMPLTLPSTTGALMPVSGGRHAFPKNLVPSWYETCYKSR